MLEAADVELVRNWLIVVYFGLSAVATCVGIAFVVIIAVKIDRIMDAAKETMKNVRGE